MAHGIWLTDDTPLGYGPRNSPLVVIFLRKTAARMGAPHGTAPESDDSGCSAMLKICSGKQIFSPIRAAVFRKKIIHSLPIFHGPYPRGVSDCCGRMVVMVVMPKVIYRRSYIKVIFIKAIFIKARFIKARFIKARFIKARKLEKDKDF